MKFSKAWIAIGVVVLFLVILGGSCVHGYNKLNTLDQSVRGQWAQVESAYQRRADLIPNLVESVKGAANFEKDTYVAVTNARAQATQVHLSPEDLKDPAKVKAFQDAQDNLGGALSKLMVVVEKYPDLKATQNFRDLQAQLEGTENRINVERSRFNDSARDFNTYRDSFPTVVMAGFFGSKFAEKSYFSAKAGADTPPPVKF
ncbi:MAG: LemA family protein [Kofleriaceae bacterium]